MIYSLIDVMPIIRNMCKTKNRSKLRRSLLFLVQKVSYGGKPHAPDQSQENRGNVDDNSDAGVLHDYLIKSDTVENSCNEMDEVRIKFYYRL